MPQIQPLYLAPLVGFLMWHLQRGKDALSALQAAERDSRFAGITPDELERALQRAQQNIAAKALLDVLGSRWIRGADGTWHLA